MFLKVLIHNHVASNIPNVHVGVPSGNPTLAMKNQPAMDHVPIQKHQLSSVRS